jgi:stage IV sporulation protein FB
MPAMRDPFSWSFPIGSVRGIAIRVHILLIVIFLGLYLRMAADPALPQGVGLDQLMILGILFVSIFLHELGHCYGAYLVEGEAREVLMWPLGGLATLDVPQTPRAHFISTAMGPAVNVALCALAAGGLAVASLWPPLSPFWEPFLAPLSHWASDATFFNSGPAGTYLHGLPLPTLEWWHVLLARIFWLNWVLLLINVCIFAYPLDGGRMLQAALWPRLGYRRATLAAVFVGFIFMFVIGIFAIAANEVLALILALIIFSACRQQWILLETGGEEGVFGYDFSQGYTSLERDDEPAPRPRKKQPGFFQRWLQRRAARKQQREQERQVADERRMDELLDKIQRYGKESLSDEENRFLKRVANKYRNRP